MSAGFYRLAPQARSVYYTAERDAAARAKGLNIDGSTRRETLPSPIEEEHSPLSPQAMGYTGDMCPNCQSVRMVHTGHCNTCQDCGETTGCS